MVREPAAGCAAAAFGSRRCGLRLAPLRWLMGESGAAQAAFATDSSDPTGTAGLWRALGALSGGGANRDQAPRG
jgi:hypothetical protein